ncbi:hypothetical protein L1987_66066 [Smallanthus sonchifolius]|uniref:Uncharacterized protein n=1 Tax=Smallanthus sonchifolius TaxID=185202 RepID=A0ACB9BWA5_9ASTR|nr:hypothetical protein L1987_66066 [Smallanthus sonchifolius]
MDHVKELNLEELQHEHPLTLVDLQMMHRDYEEDDEDYNDSDLIATQNFECTCKRCDRRIDWYHRYYYKCSMSSCDYSLHKFCKEMPTTLQFQGHPSHALILKKATSDEKCHGCLKYHRDGICYHCSTCNYGIDLLCATICGKEFEDEHLNYKCSKCMYYVHPDCATQRIEPFMSILSSGLGKNKKNFKDADHRNLLHFPLAQESHLLSHLVEIERESSPSIDHEHRVVKINNDTTTSLHDPMKRIKLLCSGCTRPITKLPFYKCSRYDDDSCNFVLHDWCTRLPKEIRNHVGHPKHTLWLHYNPSFLMDKCNACELPFNGFAYYCPRCDYWIDVNCGLIPEEITHEAHANHLLTIVRPDSSSSRVSKIECRACRVGINDESGIYYRCGACDFYLDCRCALHLPKTIRHKCDKHPLELSYSTIEDHKSQYFCEVCEEELDPGKWFYHCVAECGQSIHSACAPLILQSDSSLHLEGVYKFINVKFGYVDRWDSHEHPLSVVPGSENDGLCMSCHRSLQSYIISKCLHCNYAKHYFCNYSYTLDDAIKLNDIYFGGKKRVMKDRHETKLEFYPSEIIRPVTRHWEVVDDLQQ